MAANITALAYLAPDLPVEGAHISLYEHGGAFVTSGTTAADGRLFLGNRDVGVYELRVTTPTGMRVLRSSSRLSATVAAGDTDLVFGVVLDDRGLQESTDANYCLCSGMVQRIDGLPAFGMTYKLSAGDAVYDLVGSATSPVISLSTDVTIRVNEDGLGTAMLQRGGTYILYAPDEDTCGRLVTVPDELSADLAHVLYPSLHYVDLDAGAGVLNPATLALAVDAEQDLTATYVFRSGLVQTEIPDGYTADYEVYSTDTDVVLVEGLVPTITVTGVAAGTAQLMVRPLESLESPIRFSWYPYPIAILTVTVA